MTTIITRAYGDRGKADAAAKALREAGYTSDMIDVIDAGEGLAAALTKAQVPDEVATAYAKKLNEGQAALVARVPFFPIGAAKNAMEIVDKHKPLKVEVPKRDTLVRDETPAKRKLSVDTEHKLFLSGGKPPGNTISDVKFWAQKVFPYPHLSDRKPREDSIRHGFWAEFFPHLSSRKPPENTIQHGFWANFYPHMSDRKPPDNCIDRGGHWATRVIDVPLIISR
jgi:hypothetical protein